MANRLAMDKVLAIKRLRAAGMSQRRIAEVLSVDRKAVRRHLADLNSKGTKAPLGQAPTGSVDPKGTEAPIGSDRGEEAEAPMVSRSACAPYRELILSKLEQGLTAQRIYQDLVDEHGFTHHYHSVRRFVARLGQQRDLPFRRMEVEPGQEMQVDYGTGARCQDREGKLCKTHVFRCVLSHSRKGYTEAVKRLTTESFIRSLENAFRALGGVPRIVVFDNAKSVVTRADWYDPDLHPKILDFCQHYQFTLLPTKPRTPRHKGKVERGVGYVKQNALRGRVFASLAEQNAHLQQWEKTVADTRIHGTTKKHVGALFEAVERPALTPLPPDLFPLFEEGQRIVSRDGHVEVKRSYYSAPPEYLGCTIWVRWNSQLVRLLNHRMEPIAVHPRQESGQYSTLTAHIASERIHTVERGAEYLLRKIQHIGPHATRWAETAIQQHGVRGMRIVQGLLSLTRQHDPEAIETACDVAWRSNAFRYRIVKTLLERRAAAQQTMEFMEEHPLIRPIADYGEFVRNAIQGGSNHV